VTLSLPINNETYIETESLSAACSLQPSFCAKFQGLGLHPTMTPSVVNLDFLGLKVKKETA
jgi:hypothetical protein